MITWSGIIASQLHSVQNNCFKAKKLSEKDFSLSVSSGLRFEIILNLSHNMKREMKRCLPNTYSLIGCKRYKVNFIVYHFLIMSCLNGAEFCKEKLKWLTLVIKNTHPKYWPKIQTLSSIVNSIVNIKVLLVIFCTI